MSFNTGLFQAMKQAKDGTTIALNKCSIKRSALNNEELEIIVSDKSEVMLSRKKFKYQPTEDEPTAVLSLSDVKKLAISSLISVNAKVIHLDLPIKVDSQRKPLTKQDCIISDSSGTCKLILWEGNVEKLLIGKSYSFCNLRLKKFADDLQ